MSRSYVPKVPKGLRHMMKSLTKEILQKKPENIYKFSSQFFEAMLKQNSDFDAEEFEVIVSYDFLKSRQRNTVSTALLYSIIPASLTELIKNFIKAVLKENPKNVCVFAVEYFRRLEESGTCCIDYEAFNSYFEEKESTKTAVQCFCEYSIVIVKDLEKVENRRNSKRDDFAIGVDSKTTTSDEADKMYANVTNKNWNAQTNLNKKVQNIDDIPLTYTLKNNNIKTEIVKEYSSNNRDKINIHTIPRQNPDKENSSIKDKRTYLSDRMHSDENKLIIVGKSNISSDSNIQAKEGNNANVDVKNLMTKYNNKVGGEYATEISPSEGLLTKVSDSLNISAKKLEQILTAYIKAGNDNFNNKDVTNISQNKNNTLEALKFFLKDTAGLDINDSAIKNIFNAEAIRNSKSRTEDFPNCSNNNNTNLVNEVSSKFSEANNNTILNGQTKSNLESDLKEISDDTKKEHTDEKLKTINENMDSNNVHNKAYIQMKNLINQSSISDDDLGVEKINTTSENITAKLIDKSDLAEKTNFQKQNQEDISITLADNHSVVNSKTAVEPGIDVMNNTIETDHQTLHEIIPNSNEKKNKTPHLVGLETTSEGNETHKANDQKFNEEAQDSGNNSNLLSKNQKQFSKSSNESINEIKKPTNEYEIKGDHNKDLSASQDLSLKITDGELIVSKDETHNEVIKLPKSESAKLVIEPNKSGKAKDIIELKLTNLKEVKLETQDDNKELIASKDNSLTNTMNEPIISKDEIHIDGNKPPEKELISKSISSKETKLQSQQKLVDEISNLEPANLSVKDIVIKDGNSIESATKDEVNQFTSDSNKNNKEILVNGDLKVKKLEENLSLKDNQTNHRDVQNLDRNVSDKAIISEEVETADLESIKKGNIDLFNAAPPNTNDSKYENHSIAESITKDHVDSKEISIIDNKPHNSEDELLETSKDLTTDKVQNILSENISSDESLSTNLANNIRKRRDLLLSGYKLISDEYKIPDPEKENITEELLSTIHDEVSKSTINGESNLLDLVSKVISETEQPSEVSPTNNTETNDKNLVKNSSSKHKPALDIYLPSISEESDIHSNIQIEDVPESGIENTSTMKTSKIKNDEIPSTQAHSKGEESNKLVEELSKEGNVNNSDFTKNKTIEDINFDLENKMEYENIVLPNDVSIANHKSTTPDAIVSKNTIKASVESSEIGTTNLLKTDPQNDHQNTNGKSSKTANGNLLETISGSVESNQPVSENVTSMTEKLDIENNEQVNASDHTAENIVNLSSENQMIVNKPKDENPMSTETRKPSESATEDDLTKSLDKVDDFINTNSQIADEDLLLTSQKFTNNSKRETSTNDKNYTQDINLPSDGFKVSDTYVKHIMNTSNSLESMESPHKLKPSSEKIKNEIDAKNDSKEHSNINPEQYTSKEKVTTNAEQVSSVKASKEEELCKPDESTDMNSEKKLTLPKEDSIKKLIQAITKNTEDFLSDEILSTHIKQSTSSTSKEHEVFDKNVTHIAGKSNTSENVEPTNIIKHSSDQINNVNLNSIGVASSDSADVKYGTLSAEKSNTSNDNDSGNISKDIDQQDALVEKISKTEKVLSVDASKERGLSKIDESTEKNSEEKIVIPEEVSNKQLIQSITENSESFNNLLSHEPAGHEMLDKDKKHNSTNSNSSGNMETSNKIEHSSDQIKNVKLNSIGGVSSDSADVKYGTISTEETNTTNDNDSGNISKDVNQQDVLEEKVYKTENKVLSVDDSKQEELSKIDKSTEKISVKKVVTPEEDSNKKLSQSITESIESCNNLLSHERAEQEILEKSMNYIAGTSNTSENVELSNKFKLSSDKLKNVKVNLEDGTPDDNADLKFGTIPVEASNTSNDNDSKQISNFVDKQDFLEEKVAKNEGQVSSVGANKEPTLSKASETRQMSVGELTRTESSGDVSHAHLSNNSNDHTINSSSEEEQTIIENIRDDLHKLNILKNGNINNKTEHSPEKIKDGDIDMVNRKLPAYTVPKINTLSGEESNTATDNDSKEISGTVYKQNSPKDSFTENEGTVSSKDDSKEPNSSPINDSTQTNREEEVATLENSSIKKLTQTATESPKSSKNILRGQVLSKNNTQSTISSSKEHEILDKNIKDIVDKSKSPENVEPTNNDKHTAEPLKNVKVNSGDGATDDTSDLKFSTIPVEESNTTNDNNSKQISSDVCQQDAPEEKISKSENNELSEESRKKEELSKIDESTEKISETKVVTAEEDSKKKLSQSITESNEICNTLVSHERAEQEILGKNVNHIAGKSNTSENVGLSNKIERSSDEKNKVKLNSISEDSNGSADIKYGTLSGEESNTTKDIDSENISKDVHQRDVLEEKASKTENKVSLADARKEEELPKIDESTEGNNEKKVDILEEDSIKRVSQSITESSESTNNLLSHEPAEHEILDKDKMHNTTNSNSSENMEPTNKIEHSSDQIKSIKLNSIGGASSDSADVKYGTISTEETNTTNDNDSEKISKDVLEEKISKTEKVLSVDASKERGLSKIYESTEKNREEKVVIPEEVSNKQLIQSITENSESSNNLLSHEPAGHEMLDKDKMNNSTKSNSSGNMETSNKIEHSSDQIKNVKLNSIGGVSSDSVDVKYGTISGEESNTTNDNDSEKISKDVLEEKISKTENKVSSAEARKEEELSKIDESTENNSEEKIVIPEEDSNKKLGQSITESIESCNNLLSHERAEQEILEKNMNSLAGKSNTSENLEPSDKFKHTPEQIKNVKGNLVDRAPDSKEISGITYQPSTPEETINKNNNEVASLEVNKEITFLQNDKSILRNSAKKEVIAEKDSIKKLSEKILQNPENSSNIMPPEPLTKKNNQVTNTSSEEHEIFDNTIKDIVDKSQSPENVEPTNKNKHTAEPLKKVKVNSGDGATDDTSDLKFGTIPVEESNTGNDYDSKEISSDVCQQDAPEEKIFKSENNELSAESRKKEELSKIDESTEKISETKVVTAEEDSNKELSQSITESIEICNTLLSHERAEQEILEKNVNHIAGKSNTLENVGLSNKIEHSSDEKKKVKLNSISGASSDSVDVKYGPISGEESNNTNDNDSEKISKDVDQQDAQEEKISKTEKVLSVDASKERGLSKIYESTEKNREEKVVIPEEVSNKQLIQSITENSESSNNLLSHEPAGHEMLDKDKMHNSTKSNSSGNMETSNKIEHSSDQIKNVKLNSIGGVSSDSVDVKYGTISGEESNTTNDNDSEKISKDVLEEKISKTENKVSSAEARKEEELSKIDESTENNSEEKIVIPEEDSNKKLGPSITESIESCNNLLSHERAEQEILEKNVNHIAGKSNTSENVGLSNKIEHSSDEKKKVKLNSVSGASSDSADVKYGTISGEESNNTNDNDTGNIFKDVDQQDAVEEKVSKTEKELSVDASKERGLSKIYESTEKNREEKVVIPEEVSNKQLIQSITENSESSNNLLSHEPAGHEMLDKDKMHNTTKSNSSGNMETSNKIEHSSDQIKNVKLNSIGGGSSDSADVKYGTISGEESNNTNDNDSGNIFKDVNQQDVLEEKVYKTEDKVSSAEARKEEGLSKIDESAEKNIQKKEVIPEEDSNKINQSVKKNTELLPHEFLRKNVSHETNLLSKAHETKTENIRDNISESGDFNSKAEHSLKHIQDHKIDSVDGASDDKLREIAKERTITKVHFYDLYSSEDELLSKESEDPSVHVEKRTNNETINVLNKKPAVDYTKEEQSMGGKPKNKKNHAFKNTQESKLKWLAIRQNSMPVQIDSEIFRLLPTQIHKKTNSAENIKKQKKNVSSTTMQ